MRSMKLDLVEINKLSPPSLWDLGTLSMLISTLLGVIEARVGGSRSVYFYSSMVSRLSNELRDKVRENMGMRIKAWILQCPERKTWVRGIIGEATIRRWRKNRLADYALSKYFGDWQHKWPDGFVNVTRIISADNPQSRRFTPEFTPMSWQTSRAYNWKPFALTKIVNVERILYGQTRLGKVSDEIRAAYTKLWGTDIAEVQTRTWSHQVSWRRESRTHKPIEFTPYELADDMQCETEAVSVKSISEGIVYPPPTAKPTPKSKTENKSEDTKKPLDKPP